MTRHIIVTGGSRGLGFDIVAGLLSDGFRVSTCSRNLSPQLSALLNTDAFRSMAFWHPCSVDEPESTDEFVRVAVERAGTDGVFGLINNAGIATAGILASFPNSESDRMLRVNLLGAIHCARAASTHLLRANRGGRIINMSSIVGSRGYNGLSAYSASKAGLDGLTRSLARELGRRKITVNSIAPGYVRTELSDTLSAQQLDQIVGRTPIGRLPTSQDVLGVIRFLLSDAAQMITGQSILVDGGLSC